MIFCLKTLLCDLCVLLRLLTSASLDKTLLQKDSADQISRLKPSLPLRPFVQTIFSLSVYADFAKPSTAAKAMADRSSAKDRKEEFLNRS
jgi:hypothetical protein